MFLTRTCTKRNLTSHSHNSWSNDLKNHINKEMEMERYFIGLDVSTRKTGYAIVTNRGKTLAVGILKANINEELLVTGKKMSENLVNIINQTTKSTIEKCILGVEDSVEQFAAGRTSARALFSLTRINTMLSYSWFLKTGCLPIRSPVNSIRSALSINNQDISQETLDLWKQNRTTNRYHHLKTKMKAFDVAKHLLPKDYEYIRTPNRLFSEENFDVADALLVALHTWMTYTTKQLESTPAFETFLELKQKNSKSLRKQLESLQKDDQENPMITLQRDSSLYNKVFQKFKEQVRSEMRNQIAPTCRTP